MRVQQDLRSPANSAGRPGGVSVGKTGLAMWEGLFWESCKILGLRNRTFTETKSEGKRSCVLTEILKVDISGLGVPGVEGSGGAAAVVAAGTSAFGDEAQAPELVVSAGPVPECTVPSVRALTVVAIWSAAVCDASRGTAVRCGGPELSGWWVGAEWARPGGDRLPLAAREQMNHSVFVWSSCFKEYLVENRGISLYFILKFVAGNHLYQRVTRLK